MRLCTFLKVVYILSKIITYSKSYKKATDMTEAELRHSQEKLEDFLKSIGTGGTGLE